MSQVKIVHIISGLTSGGAETMLYKLLSATDHDRYASTVISLKDGGMQVAPIEALGIPVIGLGMKWGLRCAGSLRKLRRTIRRLQPQLIQGWLYHGNLAASYAATVLGHKVPVVWNVRHAIYKLRSEKPSIVMSVCLGALFSSRPAKIIYNSRVSSHQHIRLGYRAEKTLCLPNGFDCERFKLSASAREIVRQELGLDPETMLIGLMGRYHPMKDHGNFFQAANLLRQEHPEIHFVLAGKGIEPSDDSLRDLVMRNGLEGHVHLLGERSDMPELTAALDIATCSSWSESMPNVVGEAMACGVACVATDVGDSSYLVGSTGKIVPPKDPLALARTWQDLLLAGAKGRSEYGRLARERIVNDFSLPEVAASYYRLYEELLEKELWSRKGLSGR